MFESILMASPDPILGLSEIYKHDKQKNKINLGIGVYVNEFGNTPILTSVKHAEAFILKNENSKIYLNIEGYDRFNDSTQLLLFGKDNSIISKDRIRTVQGLGGTGSLRIAAECIARNKNNKKSCKIWISDPSWINHKNIFSAAGLEVCTYPYYNALTKSLDFDKLISVLNKINKNDIVLFHCCCHNPTGLDLDVNQWNIVSDCSQKIGWVPLFDLAYQGFSYDLKKDVTGIHIFCEKNPELIICNSYSKNFGLYNERIGACTIIAENNNHAECVLSQLQAIIRANYSNPPYHGAAIVSTILQDESLYYMWKTELKMMRDYISNMRKLLIYTLQNNKNLLADKDFNFIKKQNGMFAFMGLHENQVIKIREKFGIYLVDHGRINLAGLSVSNINRVCDAIIQSYN